MSRKKIRCIGGVFDGQMMPYLGIPYVKYRDQEPSIMESPTPGDPVSGSSAMLYEYKETFIRLWGKDVPVMVPSDDPKSIDSEFIDKLINVIDGQ